jgi:predicted O-methyltransferase YrrM
LLFIDGDHTYAGVSQDFKVYGSLVRPGGLIALHDIAPPGLVTPQTSCLDGGDVPQFWQEITAKLPHKEIIDPTGAGWFGIGVVAV